MFQHVPKCNSIANSSGCFSRQYNSHEFADCKFRSSKNISRVVVRNEYEVFDKISNGNILIEYQYSGKAVSE